PHRHHCGEVERRNARDHAHGLANAVSINSATDVLAVFPFDQMRYATSKLDNFETAGDLAMSIAHGLAVLAGNQACKIIGCGFDELFETEQHAGASQSRGGRPCPEGVLGSADGRVDFLRCGERYE